MSKTINYYANKLPKNMPEPRECTDKKLDKICKAYTEYLEALCSEDGHVYHYERVARLIGPYFIESERRKGHA